MILVGFRLGGLIGFREELLFDLFCPAPSLVYIVVEFGLVPVEAATSWARWMVHSHTRISRLTLVIAQFLDIPLLPISRASPPASPPSSEYRPVFSDPVKWLAFAGHFMGQCANALGI